MNKTELIVKASVVEDALLDDVNRMIEENPLLFEGEKVVLMADAHRGATVPVGFTMTLSKGLVPVEFVGADLFCGVSCMIIKGFTPTTHQLRTLNTLARDLIPVNRRMTDSGNITDFATLGSGNHYVEVGVDGGDTIISVHSGSRNYGGVLYKKHLDVAKNHTKELIRQERLDKLSHIEPEHRQEFLKSYKSSYTTPLLDTSMYPNYWAELGDARTYARKSRVTILNVVARILTGKFARELEHEFEVEAFESVHNYVANTGAVPILRKGAISAPYGKRVIIPINMRDGVIVGVSGVTDGINMSLPHGAGRVLSRSAAHKALNLEQFKEDMKHVVSPTVGASTLDESPRAYKSIDVILNDIAPHLLEYRVFKPVFNYKGV